MMSEKGDPEDLVDGYLHSLRETIGAISRPAVWAVVDLLYTAWQERRQVFICGNGGSAATASHMANDLCKYTVVDGQPRLKAFALTDNVPLMTAWGNDTEYANIFSEQLKNYMGEGDILIAISASGNSPNVIRALEVARQIGGVTVGLTGDTGGKMKELTDYCVLIPDWHIGRQEDGHMILDHVIATTLRWQIQNGNGKETK
ncbi:MAG: SIS domain-containing protein [Anaerolineales bacterium]|nr:SIS domain-containing protein [Anaerolineales bacterium]